MRSSRSYLWYAALLCILVVPAFLLADDQAAAAVNNLTRQQESWFGSLANNFLFVLLNWCFIGIWMIWLALNWAVLTLYDIIGNYLIPLWDFSNFGAFLHGSESNWGDLSSLIQVAGVPPYVSTMLWACVPFLVGFCVVLMAGLTIQGITSQALKGEEPLAAFGGLFMAVGLMVAFPLLYSAPILMGNQLGRDFYKFTLGDNGVIRQYEDQHDSGGGFASTLLRANFFTSQMAQNQLISPSSLVPGAIDPNMGAMAGVTNTGALEQMFQDGLAAADSGEVRQLQGLARTVTTGAPVAHASSPADILQSSKAAVTAGLETLASRGIQIVLSIMGLIGLFGLLILKGGQVLAVVMNFFLAPIACAMYASPSTRPVFYGWLKAHITVCLWSFLWAILLAVIHIVTLAGEGLQGMSSGAGTGFQFAPVGIFLMPFFLFAGIKKFNQVAALADSLSMTGGMATSIAGAVGVGFKQTWDRGVPQSLSSVAGNQVPAGASAWMQKHGSAFAGSASALGGKVTTALSAFGPAGTAIGAGLAIGAKGVSTGMQAAGKLHSTAKKVQGAAHKVNPLHHRWGMKPQQNADKQKTPAHQPPAPSSGVATAPTRA